MSAGRYPMTSELWFEAKRFIERCQNSASGHVLQKKVKPKQKSAVAHLRDAGVVELFRSAGTGAYRLTADHEDRWEAMQAKREMRHG